MINEDTHLKQDVATHEIAAFLDENQELSGVAVVKVTVLNGWTISKIDLCGRKSTDFASLKDCVREHLSHIYDMRGFDLNHHYFL